MQVCNLNNINVFDNNIIEKVLIETKKFTQKCIKIEKKILKKCK